MARGIIISVRKKSMWRRVIEFILFPFVWTINLIARKLLAFRAKLHIRSLRFAITDADKDKAKTGRKNMVVFNTANNQYEAIQKKLLKKAASAKKQPAAKNGYRVAKAVKRTKITKQQVKRVEEKSLYVTK